MKTKTKTPEFKNSVFNYIERPGPNRLRASDIHRDVKNLSKDGSPEFHKRVDTELYFLVDEIGGFLCRKYRDADEEGRRHIMQELLADVVDTADIIALGENYPGPSVEPEDPAIKLFAEEIERGVDSFTGQQETNEEWMQRVQGVVATLLIDEVKSYSEY